MIRDLYKIICILAMTCLISYNVFAGDTTGLEADYRLDEASGTRFDQTVNNNDLTDNNTVGQATGGSCQFGNCADFEVTNTEYLSITDGAQTGLDITASLTTGCFVNRESIGASQHLLGKLTTSGNQRSYRLFAHLSDIARFTVSDDGAGITQVDGQTTLNISTWYHVVGLHDNGTDIDVFVDGSSDSAAPIAHTTGIFNSTSEFQVGARGDAVETMDGLIDECFVFSRLLSGAEINDIRNNGLQQFVSGRNRLMIIATIMTPFTNSINRWIKINQHRKKFNLERPWWMKMFDIPEAYAAPAQADTDEVNIDFDSRDTYQSSYYSTNGKYDQKLPVTVDEISYETHVYDGPQGKGCIHIAKKTEGDDVYGLQRHTGAEDRNIHTAWTLIEEDA